MELEGLKHSQTGLVDDNDLIVSHLITDRHSSVKKYMRGEKPTIQHWFDVSHVAKGKTAKHFIILIFAYLFTLLILQNTLPFRYDILVDRWSKITVRNFKI